MAKAKAPPPPPPAPDLPPYPTRPEPAIKWVWFVRGIFLPMLYLLPLFAALLGPFVETSTRGHGFPLAVFLLVLAAFYGVLVVLILVWAILASTRYTFQVGAEEVVVRKGVLFRTETHIPLRRVQDIVVHQGPLLRMFGLGSLLLQTAGTASPSRYGRLIAGQGDLPGIRDAGAVATRLLDQVKRLKGDV